MIVIALVSLLSSLESVPDLKHIQVTLNREMIEIHFLEELWILWQITTNCVIEQRKFIMS